MLIDPQKINIQSGDETLFIHFENDGPMWVQDGHRETRLSVAFDVAFDAPPVVHVGLSLIDFAADRAVRAEIVAEHISNTGFDLVFKTWADTRSAQARGNWLAIGTASQAGGNWDLQE